MSWSNGNAWCRCQKAAFPHSKQFNAFEEEEGEEQEEEEKVRMNPKIGIILLLW